jgi:hypothetical protein
MTMIPAPQTVSDIPVQRTRCRNKHMESERIRKPRKDSSFVSELCCPRCGCKGFYDLRPQVAWCWASGLIEVGDVPPPESPDGGGAIVIAEGPRSFLSGCLSAVARHGKGKSEGELLVPGVPEADGQKAKADALSQWLTWCAKRNGKDGVMFHRRMLA